MTIVITGANRGIGCELARQFSQNHSVIALCRQSSEALAALTNVTVIEGVDVTDPTSIQHAINQCPDTIDVLINNAGRLKRVGLDTFDPEEMDRQWHINAVGPLHVTHACLSRLTSGSKVVLITSRMGSIADNESGSHYAYRMSKAALNMAGQSLAIDLKPQGISVGIIHPGWVQTDMTGHTGHYTVSQASSQIMDRITNLSIDNSGTFWHSDGSILPW